MKLRLEVQSEESSLSSVVVGFPLDIRVLPNTESYLVAPKEVCLVSVAIVDDQVFSGSTFKASIDARGDIYGAVTAVAKLGDTLFPVTIDGSVFAFIVLLISSRKDMEFFIPEDKSGTLTLEVRVDGDLVGGTQSVFTVKPKATIKWYDSLNISC